MSCIINASLILLMLYVQFLSFRKMCLIIVDILPSVHYFGRPAVVILLILVTSPNVHFVNYSRCGEMTNSAIIK